jgi:hypothetical protein
MDSFLIFVDIIITMVWTDLRIIVTCGFGAKDQNWACAINVMLYPNVQLTLRESLILIWIVLSLLHSVVVKTKL